MNACILKHNDEMSYWSDKGADAIVDALNKAYRALWPVAFVLWLIAKHFLTVERK